ncbi:MAG: putative metal-binding motif-containing protein [Myxococcales bacterium]|nr:putative metal-binding motif-containing protein [Myxococcales bacterium]
MEVCDVAGVDEDCDPTTYGFRDADMDGEPDARCCNGDHCGSDCDDMRPGVNPTVPEVCGNGLDDNCDGVMDEGLLVDGFVDGDGDGWGDDAAPMMACAGAPSFATRGGDCNDDDPDVSPGATETCDGVDNNCGGGVDEGLPTMVCYEDRDGDGYGVTSATSMRCGCGSGWATLPGDCADWNPDAHPGQTYRSDCYCAAPPPATCSVVCGPGTSADWDCNGTEQRRWLGDLGFCPACIGSGPEGRVWESGSVPSCGEVAWQLLCHADCSSERRRVPQECR